MMSIICESGLVRISLTASMRTQGMEMADIDPDTYLLNPRLMMMNRCEENPKGLILIFQKQVLETNRILCHIRVRTE